MNDPKTLDGEKDAKKKLINVEILLTMCVLKLELPKKKKKEESLISQGMGHAMGFANFANDAMGSASGAAGDALGSASDAVGGLLDDSGMSGAMGSTADAVGGAFGSASDAFGGFLNDSGVSGAMDSAAGHARRASLNAQQTVTDSTSLLTDTMPSGSDYGLVTKAGNKEFGDDDAPTGFNCCGCTCPSPRACCPSAFRLCTLVLLPLWLRAWRGPWRTSMFPALLVVIWFAFRSFVASLGLAAPVLGLVSPYIGLGFALGALAGQCSAVSLPLASGVAGLALELSGIVDGAFSFSYYYYFLIFRLDANASTDRLVSPDAPRHRILMR